MTKLPTTLWLVVSNSYINSISDRVHNYFVTKEEAQKCADRMNDEAMFIKSVYTVMPICKERETKVI